MKMENKTKQAIVLVVSEVEWQQDVVWSGISIENQVLTAFSVSGISLHNVLGLY